MPPLPADAFAFFTALPSHDALGARGDSPTAGDVCDIYPAVSPPAHNRSWTWAYDGAALELATGTGLLLTVAVSRPRLDGGQGGYQVEVAPPPASGWPEPWQLWDTVPIGGTDAGDPGAGSQVIASHWMPDGRRWVLGVLHSVDHAHQVVDIFPAPAGPGSWEQQNFPPHQLWRLALPVD